MKTRSLIALAVLLAARMAARAAAQDDQRTLLVEIRKSSNKGAP